MKLKVFLKKYVPLPALICMIIALACAVIHITAIFSVGFAELFNKTVSAFFRLIFAKITGVVPFSVSEIAIILLPIILAVIIFFLIRAAQKGKEHTVRYICGLFAVLTFFYSSFVLTFATAYRGDSIDKKLMLKRDAVSVEELEYTINNVVKELNFYAKTVQYGDDRFSVMPYSYDKLNDKINHAYEKSADKYPFIQKMESRVKPVIFSEPMTYTHISGVYTYFSGEANVNVNYPEYILPYTMAHEMAHQRGIAREDEANFVAFLVCLESDDDYIRYSAYLNMFEYLANALYKVDKELYRNLMKDVDVNVRYELIAYSDFFDKYRDNVAADVSGAVNNSYLVSQGQSSGTKSYGLVVDLAVAYYKALAQTDISTE